MLRSLLIPAAVVASQVFLFTATGCAVNPEESATATSADEVTTTSEALTALAAFNGCRGAGIWVCQEKVDPIYYRNHSGCTRNTTCEGKFYPCDATCPAPAGTEVPKVFVKAAGQVTSNAFMNVGAGSRSNQIDWGSRPGSFASGVGVYADVGTNGWFSCNNSDNSRKLTTAVVTFGDGTSQSFVCSTNGCGASNLPFKGGWTAVCNYALK